MTQLVYLAEIDLENSPMVRSEIRQELVDEYAQHYRDKVKMPEPDVYKRRNERYYLLAGGWHRVAGAKAAGLKQLPCNVNEGGAEECLTLALLSNRAHGLRRSNADKRQCVQLADRQWPKLSNREIAEKCGVTHTLVNEMRVGHAMSKVEAVSTPSRIVPTFKENEEKSKPTPNVGSNVAREQNKENECPPPPEPDIPPVSALAPLPSMSNVPVIPVDESGYQIPKALWPLWLRRHEIQELMTTLSRVKTTLEKARADVDPLYAHAGQSLITELAGVRYSLAQAKPYAVCTVCQGHYKITGGCNFCHNSGFIGQHAYETQAAAEGKQLRQKAIHTRAHA